MVTDCGTQAESVLKQLAGFPWQGVRFNSFALDKPGIALGCFAARWPTVEQQNIVPAFQQVQRRTDTNHAGSQNNHGPFHGVAFRVRSAWQRSR